MHDQISQYDLDLRTRKEATGTGPDSVAEIDVVEAGRGVLELELIAGDGTELRKPEWVKMRRVGVYFWVLVDCVTQDHARGPVRNDMAGG